MGIIVLIETGGNCSAPVMVRNMEKLGVRAVMISGTYNQLDYWFGVDRDASSSVAANDAAKAFTVRIPAFLLDTKVNDKLLKHVETDKIVVKISLELEQWSGSYAKYSLWYSSIYDLPYQLIVDLYEY